MSFMTNEQIWIAFGLTGQLLFTARFVVQWLSSEREKRSVVPRSFWYFSLGGSLILLVYAIYKQDLVFTFGQSSGLFIYVRNLQLIRSESKRVAEQKSSDCPATIPMTADRQVASAIQPRKAA
jgi:lipid-A-disaccharide synthase-like uncharacterized protein